MFHLSDLLDAVVPAPWKPPEDDTAAALVRRYRRRRFGSKPDDAPELRLPDVQYLAALGDVVSGDQDAVVRAGAVAACLEAPVLTYTSASTPEKTRRWWRLALISDLETAALLQISGTAGKKVTPITEVALDLCDLSDLDAVRHLVERVFIDGDRPERFVKDRGRRTPPRAVWVSDEGEPNSSFALALKAIAAVSGYLLEVVRDPATNVRDAVRRVSDLAPELILLWGPNSQNGAFVSMLRGIRLKAELVEIEAVGEAEALEEARIWFATLPVVPTEALEPNRPRSVRDAAIQAQDACEHVVITDQAIQRAKASIYERPEEILEALLALEQIAAAWTSGEIEHTDLEQICGTNGLMYSRDISPAARARHGARYSVVVDGITREMGPHLRFGGSWNPRYCARAYWWVDSESRRFVVGHIGEHLPGSND